MGIKNIVTVVAGQVGFAPRIIYIETDDTVATVTAANYLTKAKQNGWDFSESDMALVSTKTTPSATAVGLGWYDISISGDNVSLTSQGGAGSVTLPTIANYIAHFSDVVGTVTSDAANVINAGSIQAGLSGTAGVLTSYPTTAARGSLSLTAVNNTGDFAVTISNAAHAQASVYSIPDSGQATSEFIIADSAGTQNITSGALSVDAGAISSGLAAGGFAGSFIAYSNTAAMGSLRLLAVDNAGDFAVTISNASHGQASVVSIPDGGQATAEFIISDSAGTQNITSGGLQVDAGAISSGLAAGGFAGRFIAHANTTASGNLSLIAVDNASGDFDTQISNASAIGQDQVISIPDSGAATANFLLDSGSANILAFQQFIGVADLILATAGTWTPTRVAQGDYVLRHSAANDLAILAFDITPWIRVAASKGFRLDSFDVMYTIGTLALDAHSVTLDRIEYANNVAVSVSSIAITGTLATATQANPYVTNVSVDSPAFDVTTNSKYVIELSVDNSATSDYDLIGFMLRFSQTIA